MLQWTKEKWPGGRIKIDLETGEKVFYIDRMIRRVRYCFALSTKDPDEAEIELKIFEREPASYKTVHDQQLGKLVGSAAITTESIQAFADYCRDEKHLNRIHVKSYVRYLVEWGEALKGRDLRLVSPVQIDDLLAKWSTANH